VLATPLHAQTISGSAEVVDGDSLSVSGLSVRLFGIDAPEGRQTCNREGSLWRCGEEAAGQLRAMIAGNVVGCQSRGTDTYGRMVAVCSASGLELNRAMVEGGWATAFRKYSADYADAEDRAKAARRGIWNSVFMPPEEYRAAGEQRSETAPMSQRLLTPRVREAGSVAGSSSGCVIKGNRNRKGQWIYHLPGMPYYGPTRAEEMFCTEAQAQAAGYRRAIVH
jgi:endonuclease YncB( thermonuclease family)